MIFQSLPAPFRRTMSTNCFQRSKTSKDKEKPCSNLSLLNEDSKELEKQKCASFRFLKTEFIFSPEPELGMVDDTFNSLSLGVEGMKRRGKKQPSEKSSSFYVVSQLRGKPLAFGKFLALVIFPALSEYMMFHKFNANHPSKTSAKPGIVLTFLN